VMGVILRGDGDAGLSAQPGAERDVFFTVALLERKRDLLVAEIERLREAVRRVKRRYPFEIVAWVVLPDHLHCLWTLPPGAMRIMPPAGA